MGELVDSAALRDLVSRGTKRAIEAARSNTKFVADSAHRFKRGAEKNQNRIAVETTQLVRKLSNNIVAGGAGLGDWSRKERDATRGIPTEEYDNARNRLIRGGLEASSLIAQGLGRIGKWSSNAVPIFGATTGGAVTGFARTASGAIDTFAISQAELDALKQRCLAAGHQAEQRTRRETKAIERAQNAEQKTELLDLLVVGGVSLAAMMRGQVQVPPEVQLAFELAYPRLTESGESFADAVARLPAENLAGLVSGVKGKLFEMQLVDQVNSGELGEDLRAELAASPTQTGYDIRVLDKSGALSEELQAKATDSVAHVREALERYPNIDVVTTSEVHSHLLAAGFGQNVLNSGISDVGLQGTVESSTVADASFGVLDLAPSALGLALVAFSAFNDERLTSEQQGAQFGERGARVTISSAVGTAAMLATNTWWLALAAGIGSQTASGIGAQKRRRYEALKAIAIALETEKAKHVPRGQLQHFREHYT